MKRLLCGICLTLLLTSTSWALNTNDVTVETLARSAASWNGKLLPEYAKGQPEITILKITVPPKTRLPLHEHPVINAGVLLSGELTVVTENGQRSHLAAGESIIEVVDTWHYGINEGNTAAEIIVFYAGVKDEPITVKK